jgi:hypothetical protein
MTRREQVRHVEAARKHAQTAAEAVAVILRRIDSGTAWLAEDEAAALVSEAGKLYARLLAANAVSSVLEIVRAGDDDSGDAAAAGGGQDA